MGTSSVNVCPGAILPPCFTYEAKPAIVTVTEYVPGGTPRNTYVPSLCDCAINALPDAGVNVTVAPGITAFSGSATTPRTVAPVGCWALAIIGVKAAKKSKTTFKVARNNITAPQKNIHRCSA